MGEALDITVIIPTKNEFANVAKAVESVRREVARVVVVDSHSVDSTDRLARSLGCDVVQFSYAGGWPKKKNWALATIPIETRWTLILDADERFVPALWQEVRKLLEDPSVGAVAFDRELTFLGRDLDCFRPNWTIRLFRTGEAAYEDLALGHLSGTGDNEVHERLIVTGKVAYARTPFRHDDFKGLTPWLQRHAAYAKWEAALYEAMAAEGLPTLLELLRAPAYQRKRTLKRVWVRLPLRPQLRFAIWFLARRGYKDGPEGLLYCRLMGVYEVMIDAQRAAIRRDSDGGTTEGANNWT